MESVPEEETKEEETETVSTSDQMYLSHFVVDKIMSEDLQEEILPEKDGSRMVCAPQRIGYELAYETASFSDTINEDWNMELEWLLPLPEEAAEWDTDSMEWLGSDWTVKTEVRSYDFDGDGTKEEKVCQVLRGKVTLPSAADPADGAALGAGILEAVLKVEEQETKEPEAEELVQPVFTAWMKHNQAGETALDDEEITPTGNEVECVEHRRVEQLTVQAEPVTVQTAAVEQEQAAVPLAEKTAVDFEVAVDEPVLKGANLSDYIHLRGITYDDGSKGYSAATVTSPNWPDNYDNNLTEDDTAREFSFPGASSLTITFDSASVTEARYDYIKIYDKSGKEPQPLSGTDFAGKSYTVDGDYVKITFRSDSSSTRKGFSARITADGVDVSEGASLILSPETAPEEVGPAEVEVKLAGTELAKTITVNVADEVARWQIGKPVAADVTAVLHADGWLEISGTGATLGSSNLSDLRNKLKTYKTSRITVSEGVTDIADLARELNTLEHVELPESLTNIGNNAFYGCTALQEINIPAGVDAIGNYAFWGCSALEKAHLPESVTSIGNNAFHRCAALQEINIPAGVTTINPYTFSGCKALTEVVLPDGLTSIGMFAFDDCAALTDMVFPDGLITIGNYSFRGCTSLTDIQIPDSVTSIGESAFSSCWSAQAIKLPEGLERIEDSTFNGCTSLEKLTIPDSVTSIGRDAFCNCAALLEIHLPANLTQLGTRAFYRCTALKSIELPDNLTSIGSTTFYGCSKLGSVKFPQNLLSIDSSAFQDCISLIEVELPEGVTSIGDAAFSSCTALQQVVLPSSVTSVGSKAFNGSGLARLQVPAGALKSDSLYNCTKLEQITLLGGSLTEKVMADTALNELILAGDVEEVAENALLSNRTKRNLSVTVAKETHTISESFWQAAAQRGLDSLAFQGENTVRLSGMSACGLSPYRELKDGTYFVDENGNLWLLDEEKQTAALAVAAADQTDVEIPKTVGSYLVTGVGSHSFALCRDLTSVTFASPKNIKEIAPYAFVGRKKLTSINGEQKISAINALFADDAVIGQDAYRNTGLLEDAPTYTITKDSLTYRNSDGDGPTMVISSEITKTEIQNQDQLYSRLYTGEYDSITISVKNTSALDGNKPRVYVQMDDASGSINYKEGIYTLEDKSSGHTYQLNIIRDENNRYCLEFDPIQQGDTVVFNFSCTYPSPTSAGGTARIWGEILKPDETGGGAPTKVQEASWETKADNWTVSKSDYTRELKIYSNEELGDIGYVTGLSYRYSLTRIGSTLQGVGKDYMKYVEFSDVLTLPAYFTWNEKVKEAVSNGEIYLDTTGLQMEGGYARAYGIYTVVDGKKYSIASLCQGASYYNGRFDLEDWKAEFIEGADGTQKLRLDWKVYNTDMSTEIENISSNYYRVTYGPRLIQFDMGQVEEGTTHIFHNEITADEAFCYSDNQQDQNSANCSLSMGNAKLKISKNYSGGSTYGSRIDFTLQAINEGAYPYRKYQKMDDQLPELFYIEPEDMESMFAADTFGREALTITIAHASLHEPLDTAKEKTVIRGDGSTGTQTRQGLLSAGAQKKAESARYETPTGTDANLRTAEATIAISLNEQGQIGVSVSGDGETHTYVVGTDGTLRDILDQIGYMPTHAATYDVCWNHENTEEHPLVLYGEQTLTYKIPASVKSTFMLLEADQKNKYPLDSIRRSNYAKAYDTQGTQIGYDYASVTSYLDFVLTGTVEMNGEVLSGKENIADGSILDHSIYVNNNMVDSRLGQIDYSAIPVEKLLTGAQVLLAEAEDNPQLAELGLPTVNIDGTAYYLLSKDGEYHHVSVGGTVADTILVETAGDQAGKNTLIRWYEDSTPKSTITKKFKTMVNRQESGSTGAFYNCGGMTWLGDHESHRLYIPDPGIHGSSITMEKRIVTNPETTTGPGTDTLTDYSHIKEGEAVTYRIHFSAMTTDADGNNIPARTMLSGSDMQDQLPKSIPGYRWSKDNVTNLRFVNAQGTQEGITFGSDGADQWEISDTDFYGTKYDELENQQFIRWSDDFSVTFEGELYLYVTLQFPSQDAWLDYVAAYGAETLVNTFFLQELESSVTHDLKEPIKAYLNKGVNDSQYYLQGEAYYHSIAAADSRKYYETADSHERIFNFYGTVYNAGKTRLYLDTIYDMLPEGFAYDGIPSSLYPVSTYRSSVTSATNAPAAQGSLVALTDNNRGEDPVYKRHTITKTGQETVGTRERIAFQISAGNTGETDWISYDEEKEKYYLNPGEAIVFAYRAMVGGKDTSYPQIRTNGLMMEVEDYNGGGVRVADLGTDGGVASAVYPDKEKNDGGCEEKSGVEIRQDYNIATSGQSRWLYSEVKLRRGEILPGITVKPVKAVDQNGVVKTGFDSVEPKDKIQWDLDVVNSGSEAMKNYAVTDTMPDPYEFEGDVNYTVKGADGRTWISSKLFTIGERKEGDTKVTLTLYDGSTVEVPLDGSAVEIPIQLQRDGISTNLTTSKARVRMSTDAEGKAVMTVEFPDDELAIPAHGSAVLGVTTANPGSKLNNKVYYNYAYVTPLEQTFDHENVSPGNYTKCEYQDGEQKDSVENSSLLTVAYGYVTHASKSVTEVDQTEQVAGDTASSEDTTNYITVQDPENHLLRYTHEIENKTMQALKKLVVIDNLPEQGDTGVFQGSPERGSEIKVIMANDPAVKVTVWDKTHTSQTVLTADQYTVSYTKQAGDYTSEDWDCDPATTTVWTSQATEDTRALRVAILDDSGALIPVDSTVEISFHAKIDMRQFDENFTLEDAAGLKAYNSFGYRYRRLKDDYDLEATPDKVGAQIPCLPKLQKLTVDRQGSSAPVTEDHTFTFLVHEGTALDSYTDEASVSSALEKRDSKAAVVTLTVPVGESVSQALLLTSAQLQPKMYDEQQKTWTATEEKWSWAKDESYTIAEIRLPHDYAGTSFNGSSGQSITFQYAPEKAVTYKCQNTLRYGKVSLVKYDSNGTTPLSGVTFTLEGEGTAPVSKTSGSDGTLQFANLPAGTYTIRETETVSGHTLLAEPLTVTIPLAMTEEEIQVKEEETGTTIDRTKAVYDAADGKYYFYEFGFSITNTANLNLPVTGGNDRWLYVGLFTGLILLGGSLLLLLRRRKIQ